MYAGSTQKIELTNVRPKDLFHCRHCGPCSRGGWSMLTIGNHIDWNNSAGVTLHEKGSFESETVKYGGTRIRE
jgi:hypothetical protein